MLLLGCLPKIFNVASRVYKPLSKAFQVAVDYVDTSHAGLAYKRYLYRRLLPKDNPGTQEDIEYANKFNTLANMIKEKDAGVQENMLPYVAARMIQAKIDETKLVDNAYRGARTVPINCDTAIEECIAGFKGTAISLP